MAELLLQLWHRHSVHSAQDSQIMKVFNHIKWRSNLWCTEQKGDKFDLLFHWFSAYPTQTTYDTSHETTRIFLWRCKIQISRLHNPVFRWCAVCVYLPLIKLEWRFNYDAKWKLTWNRLCCGLLFCFFCFKIHTEAHSVAVFRLQAGAHSDLIKIDPRVLECCLRCTYTFTLPIHVFLRKKNILNREKCANSPKLGFGGSPCMEGSPRCRMSSCLSHSFISISSFMMMLNTSSLRYRPITYLYFGTSMRLLMLKHLLKMMLRFSLKIPLSGLFCIAERHFFSSSKYSRRAVCGRFGASSNITKYFFRLLLFLCSLWSVPCNSGIWRHAE